MVRDVGVHKAPEPFDGMQMRAVWRDEAQPDSAARLSQPVLHRLGVMIARIVQIDMDERQQRIESLKRLQQPDRLYGNDGFDLDHPGLPGLQINGTVNVDALTAACLFDGELLVNRCPATRGRRGMGRMRPASANNTASFRGREFNSLS